MEPVVTISFSSLHHIDLESTEIPAVEITQDNQDVESYIQKLVDDVSKEEVKRQFKFSSDSTEVKAAIDKILCDETFEEQSQVIANRLLKKEKDAQNKYAHITDIKKGSLLQCFVKKDDSKFYVITKVDHTQILDLSELKKHIGPPYERRVIKAGIFHFDENNTTSQIFVYDTNPKTSVYWWKDFLELEEMTTDEVNTSLSFDSIEQYLARNVKKNSKADYFHLRNNMLTYYRTHSEFKIDDLVANVIGSYEPIKPDLEIDKIKKEIEELPSKKKFDPKFSIKSTEIKARFRNTIPLSDKMELNLKGDVPEIRQLITPIEENGDKFIKIKSDSGFEYFKSSAIQEQSDRKE